jgi:Trypsin
MRARAAFAKVALGMGVAAAVLTAGTVPAQAMVNGTPDSTHTAVGSMWVSFPGSGTFFFCSGTLLSPTVFVTASHCMAGLPSDAQVFVSMEQVWPGGVADDLMPATAHLNPLHKSSNGTDLYNNDVSVLTLDSPFQGAVAYAQLPTLNLLDQMQAAGTLRDQTFTVVGYGTGAKTVTTGKVAGGGNAGPTFSDTNQREMATLGFHALNPEVLREDQKAAFGFGGAGYGDSGGPTFLGTSRTILGVTSTGDIPCYSTNTAARLDTAAARAYLSQFVPVP